jgi:mycothiol synthase
MADRWRIREYREADIPEIVALINAADDAAGMPIRASADGLRNQFNSPGLDPSRQVIVAEATGDGGAPSVSPLGYGRAFPRNDKTGVERVYDVSMRVHPDAVDSGLALAMAEEIVAIARRHEALPGQTQVDKVRVRSYIYEKHASLRAAWQQVGLREVRQAWTMRRPLDAPIPDPPNVAGVTLRNYRYPDDNEPSRQALNRSFADYFDAKPISSESWEREMATSVVRHDLSWLAAPDDSAEELAGFCICLLDEEENTLGGRLEGWVEGMGVVPEWRGRGMGKALLLHALQSFKRAGMEVMLADVDAQGPSPATRLFEAVGFTVRDRMYQYECPLGETVPQGG